MGHPQPSSAVPTDGSLSPGRRGRYHPRPPQTRTCAIHAFGSSRESFADDVMDAFGAILCHRHSLTEGIHAISSVWLSMSYRGQGLPGACPVPCFPTWSSPRDASLPSFGSQRAWFPALASTMKALRLPTCASAVAYFVHFRRPRDPSCVCVRHCARGAVALLEGRRSPPGPGSWMPATRSSGSLTWTPMGSLRSPGDPSRVFAPLLDPGRTDAPLPWRSHRCCLHFWDSEGFRR